MTAAPPRPQRARRAAHPAVTGDRGAVALTGLLITLMTVAIVLPLVLGVADVLVSGSRARSAADAAALAALAGSPLAGGPGAPDLAAAGAVAQANGAHLVDVDAEDWPLRVVVEVAVRPVGLAGRLGAVRARAAARAVPPADPAADPGPVDAPSDPTGQPAPIRGLGQRGPSRTP